MAKKNEQPADVNETDIFANDAAEISDNIINEESNNVSEQINETPDSEVKAEDVNESETTDNVNEETEDKRDPFIPVENIPTFDGLNPASAGLANSFLMQVLTFRNSYLEKVEAIAAASFDESRENVLEYAEKYKDRNSDLAALVDIFIEQEKAMKAAFENLTNAVKGTANIEILTPETRKAYEDEAKDLLNKVNSAIDSMEKFESMNPMGTIQPAIDWVKQIPALPAIKGKGKASTKPFIPGQGVSRPRLGKGGFIKVADSGPYDSFSKAMNAIITATGRDVKAPEVHTAWYDAAGVNGWQDVPADNEIKFNFHDVPITIVRRAA